MDDEFHSIVYIQRAAGMDARNTDIDDGGYCAWRVLWRHNRGPRRIHSLLRTWEVWGMEGILLIWIWLVLYSTVTTSVVYGVLAEHCTRCSFVS